MKIDFLSRCVLLSIFSLLSFIYPQETGEDTLTYKLQPVITTATRFDIDALGLPVAVATIGKSQIQQARQQLALDEALNGVPGVFILNPSNFAQDLRVSIRGFGARASFGIRGVRIISNGIPESTPDGQAQVDNIDLGIVEHIEVLRGPTSALYGNASGGVILLETARSPRQPYWQANLSGGAFGLRRFSLRTGGERKGLNYLINLSRTEYEGYRDHSRMKNLQLNSILRFGNAAGETTVLFDISDSPQADDPGGVTIEQATETPESARDRNLLFDAGESLQQARIGVRHKRQFGTDQEAQISTFLVRRTFDNRLPFENGGAVDLKRTFYGVHLRYSWQHTLLGRPFELIAGGELENQLDARERFNNLEGVRGAMTFQQDEKYLATALFLQQHWQLHPKLGLFAGLRYSGNRLRAEDTFTADGDQSGKRFLRSVDPVGGIVFSVDERFNFYANTATSFETPTLVELSNNPSGGGGFNPDLQPQEAFGFEFGIKGILGRRFRYELAAFEIHIRDELTPFELEQFSGRTFYRNIGESIRVGYESAISAIIIPGLTWNGSYTFSRFRFNGYRGGGDDFSTERIPGIPPHLAQTELRYYHRSGLYSHFQFRFTGEFDQVDLSPMPVPSSKVADWRVGARTTFGGWGIEPYLGINNLFDESYFANIRINAFGGRYYEAAAGRHAYAGVVLRKE